MRSVIGLVCLSAVSGCTVSIESQGHVVRDERRYQVTADPDVRLVTFDGPVEVRTWDAPEVLVEIEKRGGTRDLVDTIEVAAEQDANRVRVEVRRPATRTTIFGLGFHRGRSARMVATLPRRARLMAATGDGSIAAEGLSGRVELRTGDGPIRGVGLSGEVHAQTGDGPITLDDLEGSVDAVSGDGGMRLSGRFSRVRLRTGDGSIAVRVREGSIMTADWEIDTGDGAVDMFLPDGFGATVDASTRDGRVRSGLALETVEERNERSLKARLNAGGRRLRLHTGEGNVSLRPLQ